MRKIVRINTKTNTVSISPESDEYRKLAGRALAAHFVSAEVDPACEPLGPDNKMILAGMMLTGTTFSMANRLSVGCKSPLTGTIKESNVGGTAAPYLAAHGIKALILEDQPEAPACNVILISAAGEIRVENGAYLKGLGTYKSVGLLREKYGEKASVMVIGPAGERQYLNSAIMVTEFGIDSPTRAAARGGVGAVLGSKGIKAIVIEKAAEPYKFPYADWERFKEASKKVTQAILDSRGFLSTDGTAAILGFTIPSGMAPLENFSGGIMSEEDQALFNVTKTMERIRSYGGGTGHACQPGCLVKCSNIVNDANGNFLTAGFEYETIELFGPNCKIHDLDTIAKMDRFCDDFGFDTIEAAVTLGIYRDKKGKGSFEWSDGKDALTMFESFYEGGELADDFGMGAERFGKKYGVRRIPTVKGQAIAAYDPRAMKGTGTVYALSTMGADHTAGNSLGVPGLVGTEKAGSLDFAITKQSAMAAMDSHMCLFCWGVVAADLQVYADMVAAAYGFDLTAADITALGEQTIALEREFNRRAGIRPDQDALPEFFYTDPTPEGAVFDITAEEIAEKWHA